MANRIAKVLEDANIKLGAVATDILGVSGRLMIRAMIGGPEDLADLGWPGPRQAEEEGHRAGRIPGGIGHRSPSLPAQAPVEQLEAIEGLICASKAASSA